MHFVNLGESFQMNTCPIYLQKSASILPRTACPKFEQPTSQNPRHPGFLPTVAPGSKINIQKHAPVAAVARARLRNLRRVLLTAGDVRGPDSREELVKRGAIIHLLHLYLS